MPASRARLGWTLGLLLALSIGGRGVASATAAPGATTAASSSPVGSYTRYTRRLEDEAVRILTPEIGGPSKSILAAHGLDLWGCLSISEWRQTVLRWAPATEKALTVLVRRTEVLFADENVDETYGSTVLQLGSVHAMQRGLTRVLDALGVASPLPISASGLGGGSPAHPPTPSSRDRSPPQGTADGVAYAMSPMPAPAPAALPRPTIVRAAPLATGPEPASSRPRATPAAATATAPVRPLPAARSPYELAAYQGALARESYRVLYPEIENGAQVSLASKRAVMRNAPNVAEWKRLLSETNPALSKAAAVLERRAEVLRGETKVLDSFESPHTQKAAVFGLQAGLEKILSLYGK